MYQSTALSRRRLCGMTLAEVAIVLGIVAILTFFLFPVFASWRNHQPRGFACMSNEKQLALVFMQYQQDYDGVLPPRQLGIGGKSISWRSIVYPYAKTKEIFKCPTNDFAKLPDYERDTLPRSYAVNGTLGGSFGNDHPSLRVDKISALDNVILMCELTSSFGDFDPVKPGFFARQAQDGSNGGCMQIHIGGSNFVFADGHVRWLNPLTTIGASSQQPLNYWTTDNHPFSLNDLKTAQYTLGYAVEHGQKNN